MALLVAVAVPALAACGGSGTAALYLVRRGGSDLYAVNPDDSGLERVLKDVMLGGAVLDLAAYSGGPRILGSPPSVA